MNGRTHILIGLTIGAGVALLSSAPLPTGLGCMAAAGLGAMLPDIDHRNSKISRHARPARLFVWWIPHRTLTHSLFALLGVGLLGMLAGIVGIALAAGYASHIAGDMMTTRGIPLFYPLWRRDLHLLPYPLRLSTGGAMEGILAFLVTGALVYVTALFLGLIQPW